MVFLILNKAKVFSYCLSNLDYYKEISSTKPNHDQERDQEPPNHVETTPASLLIYPRIKTRMQQERSLRPPFRELYKFACYLFIQNYGLKALLRLNLILNKNKLKELKVTLDNLL